MHLGPKTASRKLHQGIDESSIDALPFFAEIVDSSKDPIISTDLTGKVVVWNRAAARVFGYPVGKIVGQSIMQLIPPDSRRQEVQILRSVRTGQFIAPYKASWLRGGGDRVELFVSVFPVRNSAGRPIGASIIASDLAQRQKLDEDRYQLAAIIDSADDAIVSKDLNGIVLSWNQGATRMFGYTADEMVGQPILRLIPPELREEEDEILHKLRAGERIENYETLRRRKNGEPIDVSVTISPIRDEEGHVIAATKIARDISDRKRFERLLIQSEQLAETGKMAATIAHEINNPLESLANLIYLARQNSEVGGEAHKCLLTAEAELERVSQIANQTLGYFRETGSAVEVYLHDLVQNVLRVCSSRLVHAKISVDTRFNDLQKITVNKGEMLQVFSNVISNSIDAMRHGGELYISIRKVLTSAGNGIQMVIRDSGTGIKREYLEKIFEPFFTTKGNFGTGIGLWVARQLIEKRGGKIYVTSSTERGNSGTSTTIFIPFASPPFPAVL